MNHPLQIAIIGSTGQGKSWLANRLIQAIEQNRQYQYDDDIEESDNIFGENDLIQRRQVSRNSGDFQSKIYKTKNQPIKIVETIGIGSIYDEPIHNQIELILNQVKFVDFFIFVQQCDYQLEADILSRLKIISKLCTPQKLIIYLSKDYIFIKNPIKWKQIMNNWNQHRDLFNNAIGLQSDAYQLGKYILSLKYQQQIQQHHKIINIIIHSDNLEIGQLKLPDEYKIRPIYFHQVEDYNVEQFDLAIIDFQLLRKEQNNLQQLIDDDLFQQKCAVYVKKQSINEFNLFYQQFKKINYMKSMISLETILMLYQNNRKINQQQVAKWLKGNV